MGLSIPIKYVEVEAKRDLGHDNHHTYPTDIKLAKKS